MQALFSLALVLLVLGSFRCVREQQALGKPQCEINEDEESSDSPPEA